MALDENRPAIPKYEREEYSLQRAVARSYMQVKSLLVAELVKTSPNKTAIRNKIAVHMQQLRRELVDGITVLSEKAIRDAQAQAIIVLAEELKDEDVNRFANAKENEHTKLDAEAREMFGLSFLAVSEVAKRKHQNQEITLQIARNIVTKDPSGTYKTKARDVTENIAGSVIQAVDTAEMSFNKVSNEIIRDFTQLKNMKTSIDTESVRLLKESTSKKAIIERIRKQGQVGFVDANGKRWKLGHYVNTTIKTSVNNAYIESVMEQGEEIGTDLAVISSHGARDDCSKWEGVIISMQAKTPGYLTYEDAKKSKEIFHPNCQHSLHLIRNPKDLHKDDQKQFKQKEREIKKRLKPEI